MITPVANVRILHKRKIPMCVYITFESMWWFCIRCVKHYYILIDLNLVNWLLWLSRLLNAIVEYNCLFAENDNWQLFTLSRNIPISLWRHIFTCEQKT